MSRSKGEEMMALQLRAEKIGCAREFPFAANHVGIGPGIRGRLKSAGLKNWRFDFVINNTMIAVEIEGIVYNPDKKGRHQTGKGMEGDLQKYDAAMNMGWTVYRCSAAMVKSGQALKTIERLIALSAA